MVIANIIGFILFLFLFWKRLKEDYSSNEVFNLCFYILGGLLVGILVSLNLPSQYWFWVLLIFSFTGFLVGVLRQKMRFFESLEAFALGLFSWLGLYFLGFSINSFSLQAFIASWICILSVFLFFFLDAHYRKFSWYKSGKVGFSGLTSLGVFFLVRTFTSLALPSAISFVGKIEAVLSGITAFILFLLLYNLSRVK